MEHKHTSTVPHTILFFVAGAALFFAVVSFALLLMQARSTLEPVTGQIIAISGNEITIADKSGKETVLVITENTKIRSSIDTFAPGLFVYSFGTKLSNGFFESKGIRIIKKTSPYGF